MKNIHLQLRNLIGQIESAMIQVCNKTIVAHPSPLNMPPSLHYYSFSYLSYSFLRLHICIGKSIKKQDSGFK